MTNIEEKNLAYAKRFVSRLSDEIPSGSLIMITDGVELALLKDSTDIKDLQQFEDYATMVTAAMYLAHNDDNVLFVTVL